MDGFGLCGALVGRSGRPLVIVQEGGYAVSDLGANAAAWLAGAESRT
jgi:acetoin utilization deacetylase AcuC-like enzyme